MQILTERKNVALSGEVKSREFTMKAGAHLMSVLSGLYNDPVDACVREYLTNMYDAYAPLLRAGVKVTPPILRIPTRMNPTLEFEDFGVGMDFDMVWKVYAEYGNSTKSDSNDEVGGFGLGSKTAFCYNEGAPWNIVTTKDGITNRFMAFVNEKGVPTLTHLSQTNTNAPNGTKVSIPMRSDDVVRAAEKARYYIPYFPMELRVEGMLDVPKKVSYLLSSQGWGIHSRDTKNSWRSNVLRVVMGNVPYTLDIHSLFGWSDAQRDETLMFLSKNDIDLHVPIGAVDIVPSRDSLKFTDRTKKAIRAAGEQMVKDMPKLIATLTAGCKTKWEQIVKAHELTDSINFPTGMADTLVKSLAIPVPTGVTATLYQLKTSGIATPAITQDATKFALTARKSGGVFTSVIVVNDTKGTGVQQARSYIRDKFVNKSGSSTLRYGHTPCKVYLVDLPKNMSVDDFKNKLEGFTNVLLASKILVPVATTKKATSSPVYGWNYWKYEINGAVVDPAAKQYYYLPLVQESKGARFTLAGGSSYFTTLQQIGKDLKMGEISPYGIRQGDVTKLDASWVNFENAVAEKLVEYIAANPDLFVKALNKSGETYTRFFKKFIPKSVAPTLHNLLDAAQVSKKVPESVKRVLDRKEVFGTTNLKKINEALAKVTGSDPLEEKIKKYIDGLTPAVQFAFKLWASDNAQYGLHYIEGTMKELIAKELEAGA